jgi:phage terminase large subunit GpA-like protein
MKPTDPWMLASGQSFLKAIGDAVKPDQRVWVDEWAEAHRVLPPDTPEPGPFRNTRTPYLIDIQRTMSPGSPFREGWFQKPVQVGGSVSGENLIGAWICTAAGSILVVFPTLEDAKQWELTRFEPMRVNTRELRKRVRGSDQKGADNTKLRKKFAGGALRLVGSNRVGALKSATMRYIKFEEPDEYVMDLGDQGSVIDLAKARTVNFGRKAKIYGDGTPTIEGRSAINKQVKRGDQRRWFLHCPDCGHAQHLVWTQMKWVDGDPQSARYACIDCGSLGTESAWKTANYAPRGQAGSEPEARAAGLAYWEATAVGEPGVASWYFSALAAPIGWRPWPMLVQEWLSAQGDAEKLKAFFNNFLGECWADTVRSEVGAEQLQQRAEQYALMSCPLGGLVCVAGVDTQDNRLAVVIRAFGRGEESWGVWHGEIYGNPAAPETWAKLRELLLSPIRHESGQVMRIDAVFVDRGGHHGEDVYAFCRDAQLRGRHWMAIYGAKPIDAPKLGRPRKVEFTWRGQAVPGGVEIRPLGTQSIKNLIDGRLRLARPGGGFYHFPLAFEADYYKQMRSEKREWRRDQQGKKALWWVKGSERNEAWDCEVYAYGAYLYAMSGQHAETVFRAREKLFGKVEQMDLLDGAVQTPAPAGEGDEAPQTDLAGGDEEEQARALSPVRPRAARQAPRPRRGFAQRWG